MDFINRANSPMVLCLEDLTETHFDQERKKAAAQKAVQESLASFVIGSMELLSQKIAHLEERLCSFGLDDLAIESLELDRTLSTTVHLKPGYVSKDIIEGMCKDPRKKTFICQKTNDVGKAIPVASRKFRQKKPTIRLLQDPHVHK